MSSIKFLSLFSGIGGFELGLMGSSLNAKCIGFSEIDQNAIKIYKQHFPDHKSLGDITKVDPDSLEDFDMLVGGFPCQSYSIAGQRKGLEDHRGKLFFDILRIIDIKQPKILFLENVKGLTNHNEGKTHWFLLQKLREAGYQVFDEVLVSSHFQIPHNRERVYIVCFHESLGINNFQFPMGQALDLNFRDILETNPPQEVYLSPAQILRMKGFGTNNSFGGYLSWGKIYNCITASYSVDGGNSMKFIRDGRISALSPTEVERLQGFPDNWTKLIPTSKRYKALGNAVTTNVIKAIANQIEDTIHKASYFDAA